MCLIKFIRQYFSFFNGLNTYLKSNRRVFFNFKNSLAFITNFNKFTIHNK